MCSHVKGCAGGATAGTAAVPVAKPAGGEPLQRRFRRRKHRRSAILRTLRTQGVRQRRGHSEEVLDSHQKMCYRYKKIMLFIQLHIYYYLQPRFVRKINKK
jgi:hypothetical protein